MHHRFSFRSQNGVCAGLLEEATSRQSSREARCEEEQPFLSGARSTNNTDRLFREHELAVQPTVPVPPTVASDEHPGKLVRSGHVTRRDVKSGHDTASPIIGPGGTVSNNVTTNFLSASTARFRQAHPITGTSHHQVDVAHVRAAGIHTLTSRTIILASWNVLQRGNQTTLHVPAEVRRALEHHIHEMPDALFDVPKISGHEPVAWVGRYAHFERYGTKESLPTNKLPEHMINWNPCAGVPRWW